MSTTEKRVKDKITVEELINLKENGLTYREIGDMLGVSKQRIHHIIKKHYDINSYIEINNQIITTIKNDFESSEMSLKEYSENIGVSYNVIRSILFNKVQKVKYTNIEKIATSLNVSIDTLIHTNHKNKLKFLPANTTNGQNGYKKFVFKTISKNLTSNENKIVINGSIPISKDTANLIKAYRLSQKIPCVKFAEDVGLSHSRISQIENYTVLSVRYSSLKKIANRLNITIEQLLLPDESVKIKVNFDNFRVKLSDNIVQQIKSNRKKLKLSRKALSDICTTTPDIISRIELGRLKSVKKSDLNNICTALEIDITNLNINCDIQNI